VIENWLAGEMSEMEIYQQLAAKCAPGSGTSMVEEQCAGQESTEPNGALVAVAVGVVGEETWRNRAHSKASFALTAEVPLTGIQAHAIHPQAEKLPFSSQTSSLAINGLSVIGLSRSRNRPNKPELQDLGYRQKARTDC
jgi:hypothetical protein